MGAIIVPSPAEIRRHLNFLWKEDPAFFWCPDEPKNFLRDQAKGVIAIPQDGATASFGGIANPLVATRRELYFPTSAGITSETDSYLGVALVSVPDPAAVRGCFIKIGSPSNGWGFGAGGTSFDTSGTKGIALREGVAWIDSGPANYFVRGLNVLLFGRTSDDVVTMLNWSNGSVDTSAATNTDLSPSAEIHINGYDAGGGYYRGSSEIVHAVVLIKRAMNNSQFSTLRDQVIGPRLSAFAAATPKRLNARELFKPTAKIIYFPSAGGGATITPTGLSSSAFGSFSVLAGDRTITFTGKASDEAFGSFSLRAKRLVSFTGKSSDEAFGAFSVHPGSVSILLNSKTTDEAYGTHSLLSGQKVISPTAKGSDSAFGSFIIVSGDRILLINGIASNEAFGAFSVNNNTANQTIIPSGYFDSSIGSFSLRPDQYIIFSGKEYLEFGQFLLSGSAVVRAMHFFDWIAQQPGLRGTLNDKLYQYLIAQGFTGSTPTMMFLWLRSLGYTGNTASMLTAFERDYTTRWY